MNNRLCDTLPETLNGKWPGLYGEVVTSDCYRLRQLKFTPDLVLDIGANVGTFARFARELWPQAIIHCVEPDKLNAAHFLKFTDDPNTFLHHAALGSGTIYRGTTAANGSGATYLSEAVGYPKERLKNSPDLVYCPIPYLMLDQFRAHVQLGMETLVKIDCEGAENCIWTHEPSMEFLRSFDYIAMEVHFYAATGIEYPEMELVTNMALQSFELTHDCQLERPHFWATKKSNDPAPSGTAQVV